jgi:hypothetical protein
VRIRRVESTGFSLPSLPSSFSIPFSLSLLSPNHQNRSPHEMSDYDAQFRKLQCTAKSFELISATIDSATAAAIDQVVQAAAPQPRLSPQAYLDLLAYNKEYDEDHEVDDMCDEIMNYVQCPLPKIRSPAPKKRKTVEELKRSDQRIKKKPCPELPWHPLFPRGKHPLPVSFTGFVMLARGS